MDLWRGLGASDVDNLTHNNLNLFITVHCQFANPLRKSKHKSMSTQFWIIWELLLLFRCLLLPYNSFALICHCLSIISYKYALILLWHGRASFQLEIAKLWSVRLYFISNKMFAPKYMKPICMRTSVIWPVVGLPSDQKQHHSNVEIITLSK